MNDVSFNCVWHPSNCLIQINFKFGWYHYYAIIFDPIWFWLDLLIQINRSEVEMTQIVQGLVVFHDGIWSGGLLPAPSISRSISYPPERDVSPCVGIDRVATEMINWIRFKYRLVSSSQRAFNELVNEINRVGNANWISNRLFLMAAVVFHCSCSPPR